jgi:hydroxypyruvate isomerase
VTARAGIELVLEPLNTRDTPGFLVATTRTGLAVLKAVGSDNLRLQYDIYHAQVMEGDLARTLQEQLPRIGHIQLADNPGRHEPGTGEINFPFLLRHLDATSATPAGSAANTSRAGAAKTASAGSSGWR